MRSLCLAILSLLSAAPLSAQERTYDIVIYGGTSSGIAAAVQAVRMGKSVVVIEPTDRVGGLTTGGLGQTDIGNKAAIGGIAREFYQPSGATTTIRPPGHGRPASSTRTAARPAPRRARTRCGRSSPASR
jgi:2-polyprenyl-6-methoxyphenol hydroxylase-like FAD-dependent oxidoreductase